MNCHATLPDLDPLVTDHSIANFSKNVNLSLETYALMINVRSCLQGKRVNRFHQQLGSDI